MDAFQRVDNQIFIGMTQGGKVSGRVTIESGWKLSGRFGLVLNNLTPYASNIHIMKTPAFIRSLLVASLALNTISHVTYGQDQPVPAPSAGADAKAADVRAKSDVDNEKKAAEWVDSLKLDDAAKATRVTEVVATHLKTIRDWHNEHSYTTVPAGINPVTGAPLSPLHRQMIANSAMPKSVHENLMSGLQKDLSPEQVEAILDKYTVGKVAFTMKGYQAIVPDLTKEEETGWPR